MRAKVNSTPFHPLKLVSTVVCIVACFLLTGCTDNVVMPAPARAEAMKGFEQRPSSVSIPVSIDLALLRERLNQAVPNQLASIDENRDACVPATWTKICVLPKVFSSGCAQWLKTKVSPDIDCHLDGWANRGNITLTGNGELLMLSMPVDASLTVRGRGDIGKHIQETVKTSILATSQILFAIDSDWNPKIAVTPDFSWRERAYLRVLGIRITVGDKVEPEIRKALSRFKDEVEAKAGGIDIRSQVERAWLQSMQPLRVGTNPNVWLQFSPQGVGFSHTITEDQRLVASLFVSGNTNVLVGDNPPPTNPKPLPLLQSDFKKGHLQFHLPVLVSYDAAGVELKKLLGDGEATVVEVPEVGSVSVSFEEATVYPAEGDRLAIGLTLSADSPLDVFDTTGTVWMTGEFDIDNQERILRVQRFAFGGETNNPATNLLISVVSTDYVVEKIQKALIYDYSMLYSNAVHLAQEALNRSPAAGLELRGSIASASVSGIHSSHEGIYLGLEIEGKLEVGVTSLESL